MRLDTRAFGIAAGLVCSGTVFVLTLLLLVGPENGVTPVGLRSVLFGYSVSVAGAFIGGLWAYVYGFLLGAILAFAYNIAMVPPLPVIAGRDSVDG